MVLYVLLPSLTSNVYFEPKFDEFVITGGDFTVFDAISDQSSQSTLESVQSLRKDEAGNKISKERDWVLSTLLVIGPSFGESCEMKADCYFVQVCCRWCCRTSVSAVSVKDVRSVRHETTSSTPHTYAPATASSRLWMCGGFCRVGSFPTWPGRCSISMRAVSERALWEPPCCRAGRTGQQVRDCHWMPLL